MTKRSWKIAATVAALIPIGFFLLFAIGEGLAGGWTHYLQALVPIAALAFAWWQPRIGGFLFAGVGLFFGIAYLLMASSQLPLTIVIVELIAFAPMILSGILFMRAAR